jgi:hypothetical protein
LFIKRPHSLSWIDPHALGPTLIGANLPAGEYKAILFSCINPQLNATVSNFYIAGDRPVAIQFTSPLSALSQASPPPYWQRYYIGQSVAINVQAPVSMANIPFSLGLFKLYVDNTTKLDQIIAPS